MRLSVLHRTAYSFDKPMRWVTQSHRLTPADSAGQRVIDWTISVEGAEPGAAFTDGAGDRVTTLSIAGPVEAFEVVVAGSVETGDTAGVLRNHREVISPRVYLVPTGPTKATGALQELSRTALAGADPGDALDRAHRLAEAVSEAIAFEPGSTHAHTTAAEALEQGLGVCQDHAHALIALAHAAEMPARYVSGYLLARDDGSPEEASHAWAEIHVPGLGWVGFDAANRCCPDERYIRLGSGRDAREAAPIRGLSRGGGLEAMDVSVTVTTVQGQSQQ
jgi:transglutaminase-like putative cysteine protease